MRRKMMIALAALVAGSLAGAGWAAQSAASGQVRKPAETRPAKVVKTEAEWRKVLTRNQYYILREAGTEPAFQNPLHANKKPGRYLCAGCDNELFVSATKFDSGTGWPSFWQPVKKSAVIERGDHDGSGRMEVLCAGCDGHLGHVFNDATGEYGIPKVPTGLRYCMNSGAMKFVPAQPVPAKPARE